MEDGIYHFEKDDIDISHKENICTSSYDEEARSLCKSFTSEEKIEDVYDDPILLHQMNPNAEVKDDTNVVSVATLNFSAAGNFDFPKTTFDTHTKEDSSIGHENPEEQHKGRAKLIRLQAVSSNTTCTAEASAYNISDIEIISEGSDSGIYTSEMMDIINKPNVCSEEKFQYLTPGALSEIPVYVSSNIQTDLQNFSSNISSDLTQVDISKEQNLSTEYQNIVLDVQNSELAMLRQDKNFDGLSSTVSTTLWNINPSSNNSNKDSSSDSNIIHQISDKETIDEFQTIGNASEISQAQPMQRFMTSDNQVVYGYKDSNGKFHFFSPTINDRESHNEKERKRRSRVAEACGALRRIIPGISEKTDKATVFEQAARYLKFLREKFGIQFDQAYCEKFYQDRLS